MLTLDRLEHILRRNNQWHEGIPATYHEFLWDLYYQGWQESEAIDYTCRIIFLSINYETFMC